MSSHDVIFTPLKFRNLEVPNRIFRSNVSGRFDNYNGSGNPVRLEWEEKFARGGVGTILSPHTPVAVRGRVLPGYAILDRDERIPFFRKIGEVVHRHGCKYIVQLSYSGRQRDVKGVENDIHPRGLSATDRSDTFHGLPAQMMTLAEIRQVVADFGAAARRVREAGLDGVELHANSGYLIGQFLSSAINIRKDEYGGSLENRARLLRDIVAAIHAEAGRDFHLQVKLSARDLNNALFPWEKKGNPLAETVQVSRWLEADGVDAIHVSNGNSFVHPWLPPGPLPMETAAETYPVMIPSGSHGLRNYFFFRVPFLRPIFGLLWNRTRPKESEGINLPDARVIKQALGIPVICTGGFQTASVVRGAIEAGSIDGVSIARPLIANPDLPRVWASGRDRPEKPCTYCNKCTVNVLANPLGCYELSRFDGDHEAMMRQVMSVYREYPETVSLGPGATVVGDPAAEPAGEPAGA